MRARGNHFTRHKTGQTTRAQTTQISHTDNHCQTSIGNFRSLRRYVNLFLTPHTPQGDTKINAFSINDDGHQRIKKRGRIDVDHKWADDLEHYWVEAIKSNEDNRFHTHRVIDPAVRLSYPPKERAVTVTQDDYMRTVVDYYISKTEGVTVSDLRDMLKNKLDGMLYGLEGDR